MRGEDRKDKWLRGIFVGIVANAIIVCAWVPAFFLLEPGERYRNASGLLVSLVVVPVTLIYGIVLARTRTKHLKLKVPAVVLNLAPIPIITLVVILLAIAGHMPAE